MEESIMLEKMFPEKKQKNEINWPSSKVTRPIDDQLQQAVTEGNLKLVQKLLDSNANVESKDTTFGRTPLGWTKCPKVATLLLDRSSNVKSDVHGRDYAGYSPLHIATIHENSEMILLLKARGGEDIWLNTESMKENPERSKISKKEKKGEKPTGHTEISEQDIARHMVMFEPLKKADSVPWVNSNVVSKIDSQLLESVLNSSVSSVKQLLHGKGDITFKDGTFGRTLLGWARDLDIVTFLINANADVNARDFNGYTPLHISSFSGFFHIAQFLLDCGANPYLRDISACTALDWSYETKDTKMMDLLSQHYSDSVITPKPQENRNRPTPKSKTTEKPKKEKKPRNTRTPSLFPLTISETEASDILKGMPKTRDKIRLVAIDYNWGPPVSGRADTDFMQLWAAVKNDVDPSSVTLCGQYLGDPNWNVDIPLELKREESEYKLYFLQVEWRLPVEFVLKLECENGKTYYDNNGGYEINYRLTPFMGRFASAIVGTDHIRVFSEFVQYYVVPKNEKKK